MLLQTLLCSEDQDDRKFAVEKIPGGARGGDCGERRQRQDQAQSQAQQRRNKPEGSDPMGPERDQ